MHTCHPLRRLVACAWYRRWLLALTLPVLPLAVVPLTVIGTRLIHSDSFLVGSLGLAAGGLESATVLAAMAVASAATTVCLQNAPARTLAARAAQALLGGLAQLGALVLGLLLLAAGLGLSGIWEPGIVAIATFLLVAWTSLWMAAAGELGVRGAWAAVCSRLRRRFWATTLQAGAAPLLGLLWMGAVSLAAFWLPFELWLGAVGAVLSAVLQAAVWNALGQGASRPIAAPWPQGREVVGGAGPAPIESARILSLWLGNEEWR